MTSIVYVTTNEVSIGCTFSSTEVVVSNLQGPQGPTGNDFPPDGSEGQILAKATDTSYDVEWIDNYTDDLRILCKNDSGVTISKGQAVMAVGAVGDRIRIAKAVADGSVSAKYMIGLASANINNGDEGYVNILGTIQNLNTSAYVLGDVLYIDPATPGALTKTEPAAPDIDVPVAIVTRVQAQSGRLFVRMWSQGQALFELFDVNVSGVQDGQVLAYDSVTQIWQPYTLPVNLLPKEREHDWVANTSTSYEGFADEGTLTSQSGWTITRIIVASNGTVTTGIAYNAIWNDRYTTIYT